MRSAAGCLGRPGMVRMSPAYATTKPAPAESRTSRTVMRKPCGRPTFSGSSEREYWVFATHTLNFP